MSSATSVLFGDEITVDDNGADFSDADFNNIQAAVDAASDGDTILVYPGTYVAASAARVVSVSSLDDLTIRSVAGPEATFIDGESQRQGIKWTGGSGALEGFEIRNCLYTCTQCGLGDNGPRYGAGMLVEDASLTIDDCIFTNNIASDGGGGLAMIRGTSSPLAQSTVSNCTFSMNALKRENDNDNGDAGAGMCVKGYSDAESDVLLEVLLENVVFDENGPDPDEVQPHGIRGGGLDAIYSDIEVRKCIFVGNNRLPDNAGTRGEGEGGGASFFMCVSDLYQCAFHRNTSEFGGGIYVKGGSMFITDCIIGGQKPGEGNSAREGGGLHTNFGSGIIDLQLQSTYIGENQAAGRGGGIHHHAEAYGDDGQSSATGRFDRCVFKNNSAGISGGGAFFLGGGGDNDDLRGTTLNFRGCSFIGNKAAESGGGFCTESSSDSDDLRLTFSFCLFMCNEAAVDAPEPTADQYYKYHGGAGYIGSRIQSATFAQCLVYDNKTHQGSGGGILMGMAPRYASSICNTTFMDNTAVYESDFQEVSCSTCEIGISPSYPGLGCGGGLFVMNRAWCSTQYQHRCLSFSGNEASYECTREYGIPDCESTDECDLDCNTEDEASNILSVEGLSCAINPLQRLFCPEDTCPADLNGDGAVDGADLTVILGSWNADVSCEDAYPLTLEDTELERMDIQSAPLHVDACEEDCPSLIIDPVWLDQLECSNNKSPDINCDGVVNGQDLTFVLGNWGPCS